MKRIIAVRLASMLVATFASQANAGQATQVDCVDSQCTLRVTIPAGVDVGRQGVYGIFAVSAKEGRTASWTEGNSWIPYTEDTVIMPVAPGLRKLQASQEYVVFKGTADQLCKTSGGQNFNLYAWHAAMTASEIQKVENALQRYEITGWQAENFWNSILLSKANKQGSVRLVYSVTCPLPKGERQ